jgi:hypothetical protein
MHEVSYIIAPHKWPPEFNNDALFALGQVTENRLFKDTSSIFYEYLIPVKVSYDHPSFNLMSFDIGNFSNF